MDNSKIQIARRGKKLSGNRKRRGWSTRGAGGGEDAEQEQTLTMTAQQNPEQWQQHSYPGESALQSIGQGAAITQCMHRAPPWAGQMW